jgi:membrane protein YqaA with SNARE-associated domain
MSEHPAADEHEGRAVEDAAAPPIDMRRVLLTAVLGMMGFTVMVMLLAWLFREPLLAVGEWFVDTFGGVGIAIGFYFPDAFTVPVPNDAFTAFGLWGGMPFWQVVYWGSLGSLLGGGTGWAIGRYLLSRSARLQAFIERRGGEEMRAQLVRGGRWFLAVAAVSPVPYSVTCWAAGATKMPFWEFMAISLLRIPRVAVFSWLIQQGFVTVGG